jgi:hypothetical protein
MGHVTMENRHGLAVAGVLSKATGTAERWASEAMLAVRRRLAGRRITVGEDKAYDTAAHVAKLRAAGITPHVTQNNRPTKTRRQRRRRDRCADHPSLRLRRVAVTPRDDRVHLWLGQTARHDAQDQAPRYPTRCR